MTTLSEAASKQRLARHGIPLLAERTAPTAEAAAEAASAIGLPVVAKLCGDGISHKTERGLVRLDLGSLEEVERAAQDLLAAALPSDGDVEILVAPMVRSSRELIAGVVRDPHFGPCVMLGVGGVLAEAIADVAFRLAPLTATDADDLIDDLAHPAILGPLRGEPPVDRDALAQVLIGLSELVVEDPGVASVDVNPLLVVDGLPVAVDALIEVSR